MLLSILLPVFSLFSGWFAQPAAAAQREKTIRPDLESLVEAERTFAAYGREHSISQAFGRYLGNALLLRKGSFVWGRDFYAQAPEQPGRLNWRPVFAEVAASGDIGVTTGPWSYHAASVTDPATAFGDFATIWRRTADGSWEPIYDGGISHAAPAKPAAEQLKPARYALRQPAAPADTASRRAELVQAEAAFAARAAKCMRQAYQPVLGEAQDLRLLHEGELPYLNTAAWALAKTTTKPLQLEPVQTAVSAGGDWGYSVGYIQQQPVRGQFLHVWHRVNGEWKLTMEVLGDVVK